MSRAKQKSKFAVGEKVRVRHGVSDPDFPHIPIGGWAGVITEMQCLNPPLYLVCWNQHTLENMHPVYKKRCERDGLDSVEMWLGESDLEAHSGEPTEIEQPTNIQTKPLDMTDEDDRIRAVFGLTSDDLLPDVDCGTLRTYRDFLAENLSFPFEAEWERESGLLSNRIQKVNVTDLGDPDEDFRLDDTYGLICKLRIDGRPGDAPLAELEVNKKGKNRQLVKDFRRWFWNW